MKYLYLLACLLFAFNHASYSGVYTYELESSNALAIDSTDTVYFDLSSATLVGNQLILPVGIVTNQPVNSLDFSFKYDHNLLDYDTIINLTTYLQGLSYYNTADSVVRFTSSSFTAIGVGVTLVNVKFNLLSSQITGSDFSEVKGYLNGVKCTAIVTSQLGVGIAEAQQKLNQFTIYPNPAASFITITSALNDVLTIADIQGRIVKSGIEIIAGEKLQLPVADLENGIYFLKAQSLNAGGTRFIVQH
jgi:hypothetical protein